MIRIAICDDEKQFRDQLHGFLNKYSEKAGEKFELTEFSSANELLKNYPTGIDLIFLDIYMGGIDGMAAAREIRSFDPEVCIIFITTMYQRAIDGYAVRAFGFIKKPVSYAELSHELGCALRQIERKKEQDEMITLKSGGISHRLPVSRIAYCEVRNHAMRICMDGEFKEYRCPMKELEDQLLPHGFLRCHASYLVNAKKIREVEQTQLILSDGSKVPISQRKRKEFLAALSEYIGEQI